MAVKLEFKGRDIDEAVKAACRKFGVERDALDIDVVSTGSTGIFGLLRRQSVVRACLKRSEESRATKKGRSSAVKPGAAPKDVAAKAKEPVAAPAAADDAAKPGRAPRPKRVASVPVPAELHGKLQAELAEILQLMGMESEIVISEENDKTRLEIIGPHVAALQERDGQALDGLQYLLRKMTSSIVPEEAMFVVDAGGFRARRRAELQELAIRLADEVKEKEGSRTIPPLNPSERRIVHMALQDDTAIRSRSVGSGLYKKVLIYKPGSQRRRSGRARSGRSRTSRK